MMKVPQTWTEAKELGLKGFWLYSRVRLLFLSVGVVLTVGAQLLSGFWDFREKHQAMINSQYAATIAADKVFEEARRAYEVVFSGKAPTDLPAYGGVARDYIQSIGAMEKLLPSSRDQHGDYVLAIANLQRFYGETLPPAKGSLDATIFYGEYRIAYEAYVAAREAYLSKIASEAGSYLRYLRNS